MAGKEKVDIKRSDDFEEVDAELTRAIEELDFTIGRVTAIFDGTSDENGPVAVDGDAASAVSDVVDPTASDSEVAPAEETDAINELESVDNEKSTSAKDSEPAADSAE